MSARIVAAVEIRGWWAVLVLLWLATLTSFGLQELAAAAVLALPAAWAGRVGRLAVQGNWRPPDRIAQLLAALPGAIMSDSWAVLSAAARGRPVGRFEEDELDAETDARRRAGRAALITGVLSATPGSVVIDADNDGLLMHVLATPMTRLRRMFGG
ncbi:Na+/H+ antiporter subunit E [Nocardia anaemiae]|uniref:Na+/H+ antiporter subunit E n=1 Tax=Nocardia anaemiae TaxID=263910 RepID=UPI0007A383F3|nr:Na+/H+ antiporter subunit E [Nocardia anaemiae]